MCRKEYWFKKAGGSEPRGPKRAERVQTLEWRWTRGRAHLTTGGGRNPPNSSAPPSVVAPVVGVHFEDNLPEEVRRLHESRVRYFRMKNITLSADEDLIERAHSIARAQRRTLNAAFREWLTQFTAGAGDGQSFDTLMRHMRHVDAGGHFSRDDLNER